MLEVARVVSLVVVSNIPDGKASVGAQPEGE